MLGKSMTQNALLLGLFAAVSTAIIAATFINSAPAISNNMRRAKAKALLEILPESSHDNSLLDDTKRVSDSELLGLRKSKKLYIARKAGRPVAVILPVTARDGYTGDIDLIVGIWADGRIAGVRVLADRETPGLGDHIEKKKTNWVDGFIGKSLGNPTLARWKVKKDGGVFDQFTGATITPRAVTKAVRNALLYFKRHKRDIFGSGSTVIATPGRRETTNHG